MEKQIIRLNENQLRQIIKESVKEFLNEMGPSNANDLRRNGFGYQLGGSNNIYQDQRTMAANARASMQARDEEKQRELNVQLQHGNITSTPDGSQIQFNMIKKISEFNKVYLYFNYTTQYKKITPTSNTDYRYRNAKLVLTQNDYNTAFEAISKRFGENNAKEVLNAQNVIINNEYYNYN